MSRHDAPPPSKAWTKEDFELEKIKRQLAATSKQLSTNLKELKNFDLYAATSDADRSKEERSRMRKTRQRNFANKMDIIDPNYGKKAAGVLAVGTVLGLATTAVAATTVFGAVLAGPAVGAAVIGTGLAKMEADAHKAVGDHAVLDSLLEDTGDEVKGTEEEDYKGGVAANDVGVDPLKQFFGEDEDFSDDDENYDDLPVLGEQERKRRDKLMEETKRLENEARALMLRQQELLQSGAIQQSFNQIDLLSIDLDLQPQQHHSNSTFDLLQSGLAPNQVQSSHSISGAFNQPSPSVLPSSSGNYPPQAPLFEAFADFSDPFSSIPSQNATNRNGNFAAPASTVPLVQTTPDPFAAVWGSGFGAPQQNSVVVPTKTAAHNTAHSNPQVVSPVTNTSKKPSVVDSDPFSALWNTTKPQVPSEASAQSVSNDDDPFAELASRHTGPKPASKPANPANYNAFNTLI